MGQVGDYLSATRGRMTVICEVHEAGRRFSVSDIRGKMTVICQLHQASWLLSVSYIGQVGGYLSVTGGKLAVICQLLEAG